MPALNNEPKHKRATLTWLVKTLPLREVTRIVATMLAERDDLRAPEMQEFQRRVADMTWPLVDHDDSYDDDRA